MLYDNPVYSVRFCKFWCFIDLFLSILCLINTLKYKIITRHQISESKLGLDVISQTVGEVANSTVLAKAMEFPRDKKKHVV